MADEENQEDQTPQTDEETTGAVENLEAADTQPSPVPNYLQDLPVQVDVILGSLKMSVKELLALGPGSVLDVGKKASEPFDLYVNNILVARGEVVMVHDRLGLRIVEVIDNSLQDMEAS